VKHLLNVAPFVSDDGSQSRSPLVNGTVDQSLVQFPLAMPDLFLQVIQAGDAVPVNHLLQRTPHRIVHRVEIRAVGGHNAGSISPERCAAEIRPSA